MPNNMKNSTATYKVVCAILFVSFVFIYIYCFQNNLLAFAQHVWSEGVTHYRPLISAIVLTGCCIILYLLISKLHRIKYYFYALTFAPSLMLLAALTSIEPRDGGIVFTINTVLAFILFLAFSAVIFFLKPSYNRYEKATDLSIFSSVALTNYCILLILFLITCGVGNTERVLHERLKMERFIHNRMYMNAIESVSAEHCDSSLTLLRAYALSKTGEMGEQLFEYRHIGGSKSLLPQADKSARFAFTNDSLFWHHLGGVPLEWKYKKSTPFFQALIRQKMAKKTVADYLLCSYLLDCDLDGFAKELVKYYDFRSEEEREAARKAVDKQREKLAKKIGEKAANDSIHYEVLHNPIGDKVKPIEELPKHYKEALTLYTHQKYVRTLTYKSSVIEADYEDYMSLLRNKTMPAAKKRSELKNNYGGTYWYYYEEMTKK